MSGDPGRASNWRMSRTASVATQTVTPFAAGVSSRRAGGTGKGTPAAKAADGKRMARINGKEAKRSLRMFTTPFTGAPITSARATFNLRFAGDRRQAIYFRSCFSKILMASMAVRMASSTPTLAMMGASS